MAFFWPTAKGVDMRSWRVASLLLLLSFACGGGEGEDDSANSGGDKSGVSVFCEAVCARAQACGVIDHPYFAGSDDCVPTCSGYNTFNMYCGSSACKTAMMSVACDQLDFGGSKPAACESPCK